MVRRPGIRRSVVVYKVSGKVVSPSTFARVSGAPTRTSGGQRTALGRELEARGKLASIEMPKNIRARADELIRKGINPNIALNRARAELTLKRDIRKEVIDLSKKKGIRLNEARIRNIVRLNLTPDQIQERLNIQKAQFIKESRTIKGLRPSFETRIATKIEETEEAGAILQRLAKEREKPEVIEVIIDGTRTKITSSHAFKLAKEGKIIKNLKGETLVFTDVKYLGLKGRIDIGIAPKDDKVPPSIKVTKVTPRPPDKERILPRITPLLTLVTVPGIPRISLKKLPIGAKIPGTPFYIGRDRVIKLNEVTRKIFGELEKRGWSKERIATITTLSPKQVDRFFAHRSERDRNILKSLSKFTKGTILGSLEAIEKEPEKIVVVAVASLVLPGALASLGVGIKSVSFFNKILKAVPPSVKAQGSKAVSRFLGATYIGATGLSIAGEPTAEERGKKLGNILTTEGIPWTIGTRFGVQGILRNEIKKDLRTELNKLPKNKREAFKDYIKQAELLGKYEPKANNIKLNNIESIKSKKAQIEIRNWLRKNNKEVIVGGSIAQTGQINVKRKLGDIDLYLEGRLSPKGAAKQLAKQLKKAGVERVSSIRGQITIDGKKAIEFHNIDMLLTNIKQVIPNWQSARKYLIRTPEGIIIQRLSLQARRKLVAAFLDPKRIATGKYKLDLKDFKMIADKLFKRAELKARGSFFFREQKIKNLEKIFGKKISRKIVEIVKPKKVKKLKVKKKKIKKIRVRRKVIKKKKIKPKVKKKTKVKIKIPKLRILRIVKKLKKILKLEKKKAIKIKPIKFKIEKGDYGHIEIIPKWKTGNTIKLYHGTSIKNYKKILKEGIKSAKRRGVKGRKVTKLATGKKKTVEPEPFVSVTLDKKVARAFAGKNGKVIEIEIPKSEFKKLWDKNKIFQDPFSIGTGEVNLAFSKSIKAKWIKKSIKKIPKITIPRVKPIKKISIKPLKRVKKVKVKPIKKIKPIKLIKIKKIPKIPKIPLKIKIPKVKRRRIKKIKRKPKYPYVKKVKKVIYPIIKKPKKVPYPIVKKPKKPPTKYPPPKRPPKKPPRVPPYPPPKRPPPKVPPKEPPPKKPPKKPPKRLPPPKVPPKEPPKEPPKIPPIIIIPKKKQPRKKPKKLKVGFFVYEKRGIIRKGKKAIMKFVKLKGGALTYQQAKDRLAYRLDHKLSRTAKLVKVKKPKKIGSITSKEAGYFQKTRKQLRPYRIKGKKKIKIPMKWIEKRRYGISTLGEKRQLALNRRLKARRGVKRKVTPQQLRNLAKGRKTLNKIRKNKKG